MCVQSDAESPDACSLASLSASESDDEASSTPGHSDTATPVEEFDAVSQSSSVPKFSLNWPSINFEIVSRMCNCFSLSDNDCVLLMTEVSQLDFSVEFPRTLRDLRNAEAAAFYDASFTVTPVPIPPPRTKTGHLMVEEESISLVHRNLLDAMQELMNIREHSKWLMWNYEKQSCGDNDTGNPDDDRRSFSELNTGDWWAEQERSLPGTKPNLLVCILSCDETPMTMTGRKVCPVYATSGNLPLWYRQKASGLTLLGFLPIIRPVKSYKNSVFVRSYRRQVKRWCMGMLLKEILDNADGLAMQFMDAEGNLAWRWVYPRFPFLIADEPEVMHAVVGGYGSTHSRMPCSHCDVVPRIQGMRHCGYPRNINELRDHMCLITQTTTISREMSKRLSIHQEFSFMPFVPGFNPFMNPADRMHQFDHGVFMQVKELVVEYIKANYSKGSLQEFDRRWGSLARAPGLKIFRRGISSLAFVPCFENRIMAMGMPFVLRGMGDRRLVTADTRMPKRGLEDLCMTYLCTRWLVAQESISMAQLATLSALCDALQQKVDDLHMLVHGSPVTTGIKFHKLVHWVHYIKFFGCTGNWNTEVFESAHKEVKKWKRCLSYKCGSSSGIKIMRQMTVRNGHTDSHAPTSVPKIKGQGPGGFRGKFDIGESRGLTVVQLTQLRQFERSQEFLLLAVEELHAAYMTILPESCFDIAMLSTVLNTNTTCLDCADSQSTMNEEQDMYQMCFFLSESRNVLQFWKKMYCTNASMYVSLNRDVRYTMPDSMAMEQCSHIGRVRWILSLPNTRQFVVIQRMRVIPPSDGVDTTTRLHNSVQPGRHADPIKRHCSYLRLHEANSVASYHILALVETGGPMIEELVMLQPDFGEILEEGNTENKCYFMLDYLIQ